MQKSRKPAQDVRDSHLPFWRIALTVVLVSVPAVMIFYYYQGGYQQASLPAIISPTNFPKIPLLLITPLVVGYLLVKKSKRGKRAVIIWSFFLFTMTCIGHWPGTNSSDVELIRVPDHGVIVP
jgi:hypothetical protein